MADQDAGWVDEDGLWWCVLGGAAAIQPEWFHTLLSVMSPRSPADRLLALLREGFTLQIDDVDAVVGIRAEHGSGLTVFGRGSVLRAALCYWENYDLQLASIPAEHAHQKAAFDRAYDAVRAVGVEVLGEPSVQGRDRDEDAHRWSAWRIGEVVLAVYQAALDVMYGLSIQLDVRRYPTAAALEPSSRFVDWMWIDP
jgi:hypothetical protein